MNLSKIIKILLGGAERELYRRVKSCVAGLRAGVSDSGP